MPNFLNSRHRVSHRGKQAILGLVAGMIDKPDISTIIDKTSPKTRDHIIPYSKFVKAMLLNGPGLHECQLYFFF